jgi:tetratricopeptide (TPR) repeat protein
MTLSGQLANLETSGLIRLAHLQPEVEYYFRHVLIQEAAYHSLVRNQRLRLHQAVGESLERLYPARLASPELAPLLARHFAEAGDQPRALRYYTLAGRAAAEMYANAEAIHHFGQALEIAQTIAADGAAVVDLFLRRGHALELNSQDAEALTNYEAMEAWAESHGDRRAQLAAMTVRATIYVKPTVEQNQALGHDLSQKALGLAHELGDRPAEAKALWNLLQYYMAGSKLDEALEYGERALQIAREEGLREQIAYVLTELNKVYFMTEQPEPAVAALEEARTLWRELGVLNMLADNLASTSMMNIMLGKYQPALVISAEAQQVSRAIGNLWNQSYSLYMLDMVHFDRGDIGQAIEVAEECLRLAEQAGFAEGINQSGFDLALIYGTMGALPRAFEAAGRTQARADAVAGVAYSWPQIEALFLFLLILDGRAAEAQAALNESPLAQDPARLKQQFIMTQFLFAQVEAHLALAKGDHQQALALADGVVAKLRHNGVRLFLADVLCFKGRALRAAGRVDEARSALKAAKSEAEELGSRRMLWQIEAELAGIAAGRGDQNAARALWRRAAEVIEYIAAHAGSAELATSFVNQKSVRSVLQAAGH